MYFRQIDKNLKVGISVPQYANDLYHLTDTNREFLKKWLPWLNTIQGPEDTREFIVLQLQRFSRGEALHHCIFYKDVLAGVTAFNRIDQTHGIGTIGYWLGEEFTGKGIMVAAIRDLICLGFLNYPLQKVEIHCAVGNVKSRSVAERLGFLNE